jgi:cytochrome c5
MQKTVLITIAALALLAGCGGKNKETATSSTPQVQLNEVKPQATAGAPDLITGEKVYKSTCSICHKSGLRGAPRIGSAADWEARLAQGNEILYDRAINGYRGKKGSMPSRGSNTKLSVDEVKAAVDYMVARAIPSFTMEK